MKTIVFVIVLIVSAYVQAFDFQPIYSQHTLLFGFPDKIVNNTLESFKVDSVVVLGDSIFFPAQNIKLSGNNCASPYGGSCFGKKIIVKNKQMTYCINVDNDTIKIKSDARLNEKWEFFKRPNISVMAIVQKIDTMSVLGVVDSVKTIVLEVTDLTMQPLPHKMHGKKLLLSKTFGLISFPEFYNFPDYNSYIYVDKPTDLVLVGTTFNSLGIQNLKWFDVFDFENGDELHVETKSGSGMYNSFKSFNEKQIIKYSNRTYYTDSIVYNVELTTQRTSYSLQESITDYSHVFTRKTIYKNEIFDNLSGKSFVEHDYLKAIEQKKEMVDTKYFTSIYQTYYRSNNDSCWNNIIADGCFPYDSYLKGLGGPYGSCQGLFLDFYDETLVYYKKGQKQWGTPFIINALNNSELVNECLVNVSQNILRIDLTRMPKDNWVYIFDVNGKVILSKQLFEPKETIDITPFNSGMYFYRITGDKQQLKSGRFVR
jgi:hypothetical protein